MPKPADKESNICKNLVSLCHRTLSLFIGHQVMPSLCACRIFDAGVKGLGLRAAEHIAQGSLVSEYVGALERQQSSQKPTTCDHLSPVEGACIPVNVVAAKP